MANDQKTTRPKLTEPQRALLTQAANKPGGLPVVLHYPPVKRLHTLGLVTIHAQRFGGYSIKLTESGWEAIRG